jgi:hypothetical protein
MGAASPIAPGPAAPCVPARRRGVTGIDSDVTGRSGGVNLTRRALDGDAGGGTKGGGGRLPLLAGTARSGGVDTLAAPASTAALAAAAADGPSTAGGGDVVGVVGDDAPLSLDRIFCFAAATLAAKSATAPRIGFAFPGCRWRGAGPGGRRTPADPAGMWSGRGSRARRRPTGRAVRWGESSGAAGSGPAHMHGPTGLFGDGVWVGAGEVWVPLEESAGTHVRHVQRVRADFSELLNPHNAQCSTLQCKVMIFMNST